MLTGVILIVANFVFAAPRDEVSAVRGSGLLFIAGVVAIVIGALLAITGKKVIPQ